MLPRAGKLLCLCAGTVSLFAKAPVTEDFAFTTELVLTDLCGFPVTLQSSVSGSTTYFFDRNGNLVRIQVHQVEQDTFSANGKVLEGEPFSANLEALIDANGNISALSGTGVMEKIRLPDGSLFIGAGRLNYLNHPDALFVIAPDRGRSGNLEGFCAAVAP